MNALAQYMPTMREAAGRFYLPTRATVAALVSAALLAGGLVYAARYPAIKTREAVEQLAIYNGLIAKANADTDAALARLQGLLNGQPEWVQESARKTIEAVRSRLADVKPVDPERILADAAKQQEAYDKAQALIEASPFKGLKKEQIPLSPDGKAYLAALDVKPPSRFEYQRLTDGVDPLLKVYRAALQVQNEAELFVHRIDVRVNGDQAGPAPEPMLDPAAASPFGKVKPDSPDEAILRMMIEGATGGGTSKSDRLETPPPARGYPSLPKVFADPPAASGAGGGSSSSNLAAPEVSTPVPQPKPVDPVAEAEKQRQEEARRQQREADRAKAQAVKAEAERKREAMRRALDAERAKAQADMDAARKQLEAAQAEEARQRECTKSIFARAKCAAQGRNPVTGEQRR